MWMETTYYNENGEKTNKVEGLQEWYKSLSKWIRKNLTKIEVCTNTKIIKKYSCDSIRKLIELGYEIV